MKISIIAAIGENNELGKNNDLIWHLPNDLKFFKSVTTGKTVLMGRNTFWSLPKVLPNRTNIVITDMDEEYPKEVVIYNSIDAFLEDYKNTEEEVFIIGGASIYKQFIKIADKIYLTEIAASCEDAQVYFPQFDKEQYDKEIVGKNEDNGISYKHVLYKRRNI
jgi:dihydrofolate reductase